MTPAHPKSLQMRVDPSDFDTLNQAARVSGCSLNELGDRILRRLARAAGEPVAEPTYTIAGAAHVLGVCSRTVQRWLELNPDLQSINEPGHWTRITQSTVDELKKRYR